MMRPTLITLAAISALLAASQAASAQRSSQGDAPYCAQIKSEGGMAGKLNCAYRTMEQCNDSVKDEGGTCVRNPELYSRIVVPGCVRPGRREGQLVGMPDCARHNSRFRPAESVCGTSDLSASPILQK
jgi:hypothetical protein